MEAEDDLIEIRDESMEENDSGSSSSSSDEGEEDDDEIKQNKQFLLILSKLQENKYDYNSYIDLITIAKALGDLEKVRQSHELFSASYPLSPQIWKDWIKIERSIASSKEELRAVQDLYQRALKDYYDIDIAVDYAKLALEVEHATSDEIWKTLLPAYGYDYQKGNLIFQLWRDDHLKREPTLSKSFECMKSIIHNYKAELLLPLKNIKETYIEFKKFLSSNEALLKELQITVDNDKMEKSFRETLQILNKIKPFEEELESLAENDYNESVKVFLAYLRKCDSLEEENVQILYERMISASCLNVTVWKEYIKYIQSRPENWRSDRRGDSSIFHQSEIDLVMRALRNCSWSEDLYIEKMRIFEKKDSDQAEIQSIFEEAYATEYRSPNPQVKLWLHYLSFMSRHTDYSNEDKKDTLRNCFKYAWDSLGKQWGDLADTNCEILKFWGRLEYNTKMLNNPSKGKDLWKTAQSSGNNYQNSGFWIEYALLEQARNEDGARKLYKMASEIRELDNVDVLASSWLRFEYVFGSLEQLRTCQDVCNALKQEHYQSQKGRNFNPKKTNLKRKNFESAESSHQQKVPKTDDTSNHRNDKIPHQTEIDKSKDRVRIFFSNLDYEVTEDCLKEELSEIPIVSVNIIKSNNGKSRGFGYAEVLSEKDVELALNLDRKMIKGRPIFISKCERENDSRNKFKYATEMERNKVFVKGLASVVESKDLENLFNPFGGIKEVRLVVDKNGRKKGIAYIEFENESSAKKCIMKLDQTTFFDKTITVAISNPPGDNKRKFDDAHDRKTGFIPPKGAKPRLMTSMIPTSVQKKPDEPAKSIDTSQKKSNDDFRKMFLK